MKVWAVKCHDHNSDYTDIFLYSNEEEAKIKAIDFFNYILKSGVLNWDKEEINEAYEELVNNGYVEDVVSYEECDTDTNESIVCY